MQLYASHIMDATWPPVCLPTSIDSVVSNAHGSPSLCHAETSCWIPLTQSRYPVAFQLNLFSWWYISYQTRNILCSSGRYLTCIALLMAIILQVLIFCLLIMIFPSPIWVSMMKQLLFMFLWTSLVANSDTSMHGHAAATTATSFGPSSKAPYTESGVDYASLPGGVKENSLHWFWYMHVRHLCVSPLSKSSCTCQKYYRSKNWCQKSERKGYDGYIIVLWNIIVAIRIGLLRLKRPMPSFSQNTWAHSRRHCARPLRPSQHAWCIPVYPAHHIIWEEVKFLPKNAW